jgi:hypothetical protein
MEPGELKQPGGVVLISCYELGHQPLSLASPLGFLEEAGFAPDAIDVSVDDLDPDRVKRARFVGISVPMHTALRLGVQVAERVRAINPGCHLCFYGLYATLNAEYLLERLADSVIGGEYEVPLRALVRAVESDDPAGIEGVTRRQGASGPARPFLERLPFVPPSRERLPRLERYARLEREGRLYTAGYVEASRGCKHLCRHCPIPPVYGGRFFVVPEQVVLEDVRRQVEAGAAHLTFGDPDFLNGPGHALRIARAVHGEFPALTWDFTAKVEHLLKHRALLSELRSLGCVFLISAVESLSDTVLVNLDKGHTAADAREALRLVRSAGIAFRPSLLPFTPWSGLADHLELFEWIAGEEIVDNVDPVQLTIRLLVPPGSWLLEGPALRPFLGSLSPAALSYRWTHPDPRMDWLQEAGAALAASSAREREDPRITFRRLWAMAEDAAGAGSRRRSMTGRPRWPAGARTPRLTESWFC